MQRGWLAGAVVAALATLGSPAIAQQAPSLAVTPSEATVGTPVEVAGSSAPAACSAPASEVVVAVTSGPELGRVPAEALGDFVLEAVVPDLAPGDHTITSTCVVGTAVVAPVSLATATLRVLPVTAESGAPTPEVTDGAHADGAQADGANADDSTTEGAADGEAPHEAASTGGPAEPTHDEAHEPATPRGTTGASTSEFGRRRPPVTALPRTDTNPAQPDGPTTDLAAAPTPVDASDTSGAESALQPGEFRPAPERFGPAQHIRRLTDPDLTSKGLSATAMLLLAFSLLIGFPATMFDGTYRAHYDQIVDGVRRRVPALGRHLDSPREAGRTRPLLGMVAFGTLASAALDPALALDRRSFAIISGLAVVVGLAGWLGWWPTKLTSDAYGNEGRYRAYPMGLGVAILCVMITRFGDLHPGYLYGLLFAYETRGRWSKRDDGLTFLLGFAVVFAVGLGAWLGLSIWEPGAGEAPGTGALVADTVLAGLTVAGIEGVVFGMIPFRFAPGYAIWTWSRAAWWALWVPGVLALGVMLSTPDRDLLTVQSEEVSVVRAAIAFAVFCVVSVSFWAYWRRRETRSTVPDHLTAAPAPLTPAAVTGPADERVLVDA